MEKKFINGLQKSINKTSSYSELLLFLEKQKDFLLSNNLFDKIESEKYNSMWDTLYFLKSYFKFSDSPNIFFVSKLSILEVFNYNLDLRMKLSELRKQKLKCKN